MNKKSAGSIYRINQRMLTGVMALLFCLLLVCTALAETDPGTGLPTYEGAGSATPEEAVALYLEGLKNGNLYQMLSAFAIETYAEKVDLLEQMNRVSAYNPAWPISLPNTNPFFEAFNAASRKHDIVGQIKVLTALATFPERDIIFNIIPFKGEEGQRDMAQFYAYLEALSEPLPFADMELMGFVAPEKIYDKYTSEHTLQVMGSKLRLQGGNEVVAAVAVLTLKGDPYIFCCDVIRYKDKWSLLMVDGVVGSWLAYRDLQGKGLYAYEASPDRPAISIKEAPAPTPIYEGPGFETPHEAARSYLEGLQKGDLSQMLGAFAIESCVDNYQLLAHMQLMEAYSNRHPINLLNANPLFRAFNTEYYVDQILRCIRNQILLFEKPEYQDHGQPTSFSGQDREEKAAHFLEGFEASTKELVLQGLTVTADIPIGAFGSDHPSSIKRNKQSATIYGASECQTVGIAFTIDEKPYVFSATALCYNGRWYLQGFDPYFGYLSSVATDNDGIRPIEEEVYSAILSGKTDLH